MDRKIQFDQLDQFDPGKAEKGTTTPTSKSEQDQATEMPYGELTLILREIFSQGGISHTFEWHHINLKDNPTDPLSRGLSVEDLNGNNIWWRGPDCLHSVVDFLNNWEC
ncbi:hypothetical protein TNCV_2814391 [Trichonephila clavipes]|nr:hypothetical protein TNCV_2814391 [Trichonephila clavipes]